MKCKNWMRVITGGLLVVAMVAMMAGCTTQEKPSGPEDGDTSTEVADEVKQAQDSAAEERKAYEESIGKMDVLSEAVDLKAVDNLVETYYDVATEDFSDMVAYESATTEEKLPTHIFIGKTVEGADNSALSSQLLDVAVGLGGMDQEGAEIEVAANGGFIILAAAPNGSDIANKFAQVIANGGVESAADAYKGLRADLTAEE